MSYDLLLINTHRRYDIEQAVQSDWMGIYILSSYIQQNGYEARAFSGYAHEIMPMLEKETSNGVKVIGFSCDYENQIEVASFCRLIQERWKIPVIVGGPQAIALDKSFLLTSKAFGVVRGEGEIPLLALMQFLVDKTGSIDDIPGFVYLKNNEICYNQMPKPIMNLDEIPFVNPSLAIGKKFFSHTASFLTARGCPFHCSFCYEGSNTRYVRWRSVDNVMKEIETTLDNNKQIKFIIFTDDTFTLNFNRVKEFCYRLSKYREKRDFCWFAEAHPQTIVRHPDIVKLMVGSGLASLQIGVESGCEHILKAYNKKTNTNILRNVVEICYKAHVPHLIANIIVGGAFETEETIAKSQEFGLHLMDIGAGMLEMHAVHFWPLPNTAMTTRPDDYGMEILDPESKTSATDYPVVKCGNLTPEILSQKRFEMENCFRNKVKELAYNLPIQQVKKLLQCWFRYEMINGYIDILLKIDRYRRYVGLYEEGAIKQINEIPNHLINNWHPQRQCQPLTINGEHYADDHKISKDEYTVLVASSGRMTVAEASAYCKMDIVTFLNYAKKLEEIMAVGFCEF